MPQHLIDTEMKRVNNDRIILSIFQLPYEEGDESTPFILTDFDLIRLRDQANDILAQRS